MYRLIYTLLVVCIFFILSCQSQLNKELPDEERKGAIEIIIHQIMDERDKEKMLAELPSHFCDLLSYLNIEVLEDEFMKSLNEGGVLEYGKKFTDSKDPKEILKSLPADLLLGMYIGDLERIKMRGNEKLIMEQVKKICPDLHEAYLNMGDRK